MQIVTKGHQSEDAVRQVIQLFFSLSSEMSVCSTLVTENKVTVARASIKMGDNEVCGEATASINPENKREVSDLVKKSVFIACRKISDMPTPWGISTGIRPAKTARMMLDQKASDEEIISYMQSELWTTEEKARLSLNVAKREKEILDKRLKNGISLYIGIPFCPTRCAYCSFISQAKKHNDKFVDQYVLALMREIEFCAELTEKYNLSVETVYFGGGTPTAISPENLNMLLEAVRKNFDLSNTKEYTVEAGRPDTFSLEMLDVLKNNAVGRISINPQTMNQKTLDRIGRKHTVEQTVEAFNMARKYDFSINADLIAGLPEETPEDFNYTLDELLKLTPDAITVHTMYLKRAANLISEFEKYRFTSEVSEMMRIANEKMENEDYAPYYLYKQKNTLGNLENIGFCRNGHECLYNIYIMEEVHTVLAMGGGASTKMVCGDRIERIFNPKEAADYINRIDEIIEKKRNNFLVEGFCD